MHDSDPITRWPAWALPILTLIWLGCFAYLGLASRLPGIPGLTGRGESVASSGHFVTTLVLAVLVYGLIRARSLDRPVLEVAATTVLAATVAGGIIELLQSFSRTRTPQWGDLVFDGLGALAGVVMMAALDRRPARRPKLVAGANGLGASAVILTISAFFIWPPIAPAEVTAYCPAGVAERRVPVVAIEPGTGSRVTEELLALYTFEETAADLSGVQPSLDLSLEGSAQLRNGRFRVTGEDGLARSTIPPTKIYDAAAEHDALTLEAWVRPGDLLQRGPARIVTSSGSTSLSDVNFHLGQERTCLSLRVGTGGGAAEWLLFEDVFTTPQPTWHLVVTIESSAVEVFVDGMLVGSETVGPGGLGSWNRSLPLIVGNEATGDRPFRGDFLLVAVYGRALTASEVAQNYRAGALQGKPGGG